MSAPEEPGLVRIVGEPKHFELETLTRDLERIHGKGNARWKLIRDRVHKVELVSITIETEDISTLVEHFKKLGVEVEWTQK
jgi:hypothetical protein